MCIPTVNILMCKAPVYKKKVELKIAVQESKEVKDSKGILAEFCRSPVDFFKTVIKLLLRFYLRSGNV